ncbi:MAG TPA: glycosyltransferase [Syntrophomonas sp.]|nr:glycosyltransferase [Syntrophomonas sp.]
MKECTETDKPLISIVMATYNPRLDWLKEQLVSLENQTYRPLELLILDDCSTKVGLDEIQACVENCIQSIPYQIMQNEENMGSTRTFEKLTLLANGEYITYCDQDDVWHKDKIDIDSKALEHSDVALVFSDMNIIDTAGNKVADSITKVRRHHKFHSGKNLGSTLLFKNFVTGCTMMTRTFDAQSAVPFCPYMVHDHWLALYGSIKGEILFLRQSLVDYRIHESNQTLMLAGVTDKGSYVEIRIEEPLRKFLWLQKRFKADTELNKTISQAIEWMTARRDNFKIKGSNVRVIWKYRKFSKLTSLFEIAAPLIPEKLFLFFIGLARKNIV